MAETSDSIRLDQFLKLSACAATGGHAKLLIQSGAVCVNGEVETRRRRKLVPGDRVLCEGQEIFVLSDDDPDPEPAEDAEPAPS